MVNITRGGQADVGAAGHGANLGPTSRMCHWGSVKTEMATLSLPATPVVSR